MARLPQPGADADSWGDLLNEFLLVEHDTDGTLRLSATIQEKYTKPNTGIPLQHLSDDIQSLLAQVTPIANRTFIPADVGLANVSNDLQLKASNLDIDVALFSNSDIKIPSQHAVKTYVDSSVSNVTSMLLPKTGGTLSGSLAITSSTPTNTLSVRTGSATPYIIIDNSNTDSSPNGRLSFYRDTTLSGSILATAANGLFINSGNRVDVAVGGVTKLYWTSSTVTFSDALNVAFGTTTGTKIGTTATQKIGFFGGTPIVRPTVTGSKTSGAALSSLLSALVSLGLINDTTTA